MEPFYYIVVGIAVVFMILILIFIGLMMKTQNQNTVYPPVVNTCPDNWSIAQDGSSCTIPIDTKPSNMGSLITNANVKTSLAKYATVSNNTFSTHDPLWSSNGVTAICGQKQWAVNNQISWDGISNYNSC
jgi:hypothetical protein